MISQWYRTSKRTFKHFIVHLYLGCIQEQCGISEYKLEINIFWSSFMVWWLFKRSFQFFWRLLEIIPLVVDLSLLFDESVLPMKVLDLVHNYLVTSLEKQNNHWLELSQDQLSFPITKPKNIFHKKNVIGEFRTWYLCSITNSFCIHSKLEPVLPVCPISYFSNLGPVGHFWTDIQKRETKILIHITSIIIINNICYLNMF